MATINLPFAASATRRAPTSDELANGFGCGDADKQLFDWLEWWLTGQVATAISEGGLTVDDAILSRLAQAIQSGKSTFAVATGTANAWVVAPSLAVPAYAAGRVLWVKAPATNTATSVTANVSTLGTRAIKKRDGTDPAIGDLVAGVWYATIDDGSSICVVSPLPSERVAKAQIFRAPAASNAVPSGVTTKITNFGTVKNTLSDLAVWDGTNKKLTIAAGGDGVYDLSVTLDTNLGLGTAYGMSMSIGKNGGASIVGFNSLSGSTGVLGPFGSASRTVELVAGDYLEVFARHNFGSDQDFKVDFVAKFVGRS